MTPSFWTALDGKSDSDDELMPDPEIIPPFSTAEWTLIVRVFKELQSLYQSAVKHFFQNVHGKYFVEQFIKICSMLDNNMYVLIRTSDMVLLLLVTTSLVAADGLR